MKLLISAERMFTLIILLNVNMESLIHGYFLKSTEELLSKPSHFNANSNSNPRLNFEESNNFFTDYDDEFVKTNSINNNENIYSIKQKDFQLEKLNYRNRLAERLNPTSTIMQPLEISSEDKSFAPILPKENPTHYTFPFSKFTNNKQIMPSSMYSSTDEYDTDDKGTLSRLPHFNWEYNLKNVNINRPKLTFESKPNYIAESTEASSSKSTISKEHENTKVQTESPTNSGENSVPKLFQQQELKKLASQLHKYEDDGKPTEVVKHSSTINNTNENNKNYIQSEDQNIQEHIKFSAIHATERKLIDAPWNLYKGEAFPDVKPFPELYDSEPSQEKLSTEIRKTNLIKNVFPLNAEERNQENAGPSLYPKSNFVKEFNVPFFVK